MAIRLENPNVDDYGLAGVELTAIEFDEFLSRLRDAGAEQSNLEIFKAAGFVPGLTRCEANAILFQWLNSLYGISLQSDVAVIAVAREGCVDLMRQTIRLMWENRRP